MRTLTDQLAQYAAYHRDRRNIFVVGWAIQFVGHAWEDRKPAFVDDVIGLLVGPLFVAAEVLFALGLRRDLQRAIDARVGPVHDGERAAA